MDDLAAARNLVTASVASQRITSPEQRETPPAPAGTTLAALLLADGRFPAGGHAHSAGAEAACADGRVVDEPSLAAFVEGRLRTAGLVDAALAAATTLALARCTAEAEVRGALVTLDAEADARIVAPPLRTASRRLGRQLVRVAGRCWPDSTLAIATAVLPDGAHQPVALGAVGVAAGLDAGAIATLCVHHTVTTPAQAAVRLLGLDPFGVAALTARLAPLAAAVAADATTAAHHAVADVAAVGAVTPGGADDVPAGGAWLAGLAGLPALSGPLVEIAALDHRTWDVRMFAT